MSPFVPITDPGPDPETGIDPWPTLANAYANSAITSRGDCALLNASLLAIYMNSWNMWAAQVVGGYPHDAAPPQPPPAWVSFVDDPSGDPTQGYTRIKIGSMPICALPPTPVGPPVPPAAPPNNVDIGNNIPVSGQPSHFWQVGPMDTWPVGKYTPPNAKSADGTVGSFLRLGAVVGSGWYER